MDVHRDLAVRADPGAADVRIAGEEADLTWPERSRIIEIDGPQYHQFAAEDARKQRIWESAGYTVRRIASDLVYEAPARLIALAGPLR
jgi:very-short-patch-repair endonuclease